METGADQQSIGDSVASAAASMSGDAGNVAAAPAVTEPALELPGGKWNDEQKQLFSQIGGVPEHGRKFQQLFNDVYKSMQGDYTRKTQELAGFRKEYDSWQQMLQPYLPQWQRAGVQPLQGMQQVLGWASYLASNPKPALLELAKTYGVDLSEVGQEQPYVDPSVRAVQQQMSQMQQHLHMQQVQAQQAQQARILDEIRAFESSQDESGNPKYPYFHDVYSDMIALLQSGNFKDLESAYEYATYGNRDVRTRIAEQTAKAEAAKRAAEAQKAVDASRNVSAKAGGKSPNPSPHKTLRDEIAAHARALSG